MVPLAPAAAAILAALAIALPAHSSPTAPVWPSTSAGAAGPGGQTGPSGTAKGPKPALCKRYRPRLLCPDLIMSAPSRLEFDRTTIRGRVLLRAASSVNSLGSGPMELSFHRNGSHMKAYQAIYDIRGGRHLFLSKARLTFKYVPGERYVWPSAAGLRYPRAAEHRSPQLLEAAPRRRISVVVDQRAQPRDQARAHGAEGRLLPARFGSHPSEGPLAGRGRLSGLQPESLHAQRHPRDLRWLV